MRAFPWFGWFPLVDIFFEYNTTVSVYAVVLVRGLFYSTTLLRYSLPIFDVYLDTSTVQS